MIVSSLSFQGANRSPWLVAMVILNIQVSLSADRPSCALLVLAHVTENFSKPTSVLCSWVLTFLSRWPPSRVASRACHGSGPLVWLPDVPLLQRTHVGFPSTFILWVFSDLYLNLSRDYQLSPSSPVPFENGTWLTRIQDDISLLPLQLGTAGMPVLPWDMTQSFWVKSFWVLHLKENSRLLASPLSLSLAGVHGGDELSWIALTVATFWGDGATRWQESGYLPPLQSGSC